MKNLFYTLLAILLVSLLLSSCKNNESKLTILGENSSNIHSMQALQLDYEEKSGIKLDFKSHSLEDAFNKSNEDFANRTGLYDLILQYNFSLSSFVRNDYVYKLSELKTETINNNFEFENDIFPNVWKEVGYYYKNPKQPNDKEIEPISYPFAANTILLVYNQDLFNDAEQKKNFKEKYGKELTVPNDLKSFREVAEFFTQPDKDLKGVVLQGAIGGWLYFEWCSFLQGFGGKVLDKNQGWQGNENTPVLITNEQAIAATEYYKSLKPFNAGNFVTTDAVEQQVILKQGNVAMGLIWSDYALGLIDKGNGEIDTRFAFAPTPGDKSMIAGGAYYINKQSKMKEEAFDYMVYLLQKENQVKMIQHGLCAPTISAYNAPEAQKIPYVPALKTSLLRAEYMLEAGPDADLINNVITTYIQKIWNSEIDVKIGLNTAKMEIEKERTILFQ
ncbi:MAG: extracellular solute-binding protein [Bacteroidales bacterium]|nr:extracellular solute-binding protein [Acholeplasmataceae bacterium]MCK9447742.1 extracellular solute-binding protein [Bacteroidales bacterium]